MSSIVFAQDDALKYADELNHQAILLSNQGKFSESIPIALKALAIREQVLGSGHLMVAQSLNNLGELYRHLAEYSRAESYYKRSLAIVKKALGDDSLGAAAIRNNMALLYLAAGRYSKAEQFGKKSLAVYKKKHGPDHQSVANSLNNMGLIYDASGKYARAEDQFKQALTIWEKTLGPDHPKVAAGLNNLSFLYQDQGDYSKAEALCIRSLAIREKNLGSEHPDVTCNLNNLGALYKALGDYSSAESFFKRSLSINEKVFGSEHPDVAANLNDLGEFYYYTGDYSRAESFLKRSLDIRVKTLGFYHLKVAQSMNILGSLYDSLGEHYKAISLYKRSLDITENAVGPENRQVASILNNLALIYMLLGYHSKAESLYNRSLIINEKIFGSEHPGVATGLNNLAKFYARTDKYAKANYCFTKAQSIDERFIEDVMTFTSEDQKFKFLSLKKGSMFAFISFVNEYKAQLSSSAPREALDVWLKRKGVILEAQKRFQEAVFYSEDPGAAKKLQGLARKRSRLSKLTFSGPGKEGPQRYSNNISKIKKDIRDLEAELSRISRIFALRMKKLKADSVTIGKSLPEKTVLIEFARIKTFNFKSKATQRKWGKDIYLAFVVHSGKGQTPEFIDLGDAEKIDNMVSRLKKEIAGRQKTDPGKNPGKVSNELYDLVFAPLKNSLGNTKKIFISPDGNLNLIPFEILQDHSGKYLIETYAFNYLSAGRDILDFGQIKGKKGKVVLIGDPDFEMNSIEKENSLRKLGINLLESKDAAVRSAQMRGLHFDRLPGTRKEVESIHALMGDEKSVIYTGKEALEDVLKLYASPSVLHLATHGFFLSDSQMGRAVADARDINIKKAVNQVKQQNPLLRSGIALAGANNALDSHDANESDGIVTAEKILGLRMTGTGMVVLSACETGLGEVKSGEGVYGLRRAFTQAGAKSLVMSMWSVPDRETQELMTEFYKNILIKKMDRAQALRQAQLTQMEITKARYKEDNPFYWGAFIFLGEP